MGARILPRKTSSLQRIITAEAVAFLCVEIYTHFSLRENLCCRINRFYFIPTKEARMYRTMLNDQVVQFANPISLENDFLRSQLKCMCKIYQQIFLYKLIKKIVTHWSILCVFF